MILKKRKTRNYIETFRPSIQYTFFWLIPNYIRTASRMKPGDAIDSEEFNENTLTKDLTVNGKRCENTQIKTSKNPTFKLKFIPQSQKINCKGNVAIFLYATSFPENRGYETSFDILLKTRTNKTGEEGEWNIQSRHFHWTFPSSAGEVGFGSSNFVEQIKLINQLSKISCDGAVTVECVLKIFETSCLENRIYWKSNLGISSYQLRSLKSMVRSSKRKEYVWHTNILWHIKDFPSILQTLPGTLIESESFSADDIIKWKIILLRESTKDCGYIMFCLRPEGDLISPYSTKHWLQSQIRSKFQLMTQNNRVICEDSFTFSLPCTDQCDVQRRLELNNDEILEEIRTGSYENNNLKIYCEVSNTDVLDDSNKKSINRLNSSDSQSLSDADVRIRSKDGTEFLVHKNYLVENSDFFKAMFSHDMQESTNNLVELAGVDKVTLKAMIDFIYGDFGVVDQYPEELLCASDEYQFEKLNDLCQKHLIRNLTRDNMIDYCIMAHSRVNASLLKDCSMNLIVDHINKLDNDLQWIHFCRDYSELFQSLKTRAKDRTSLRDMQWLWRD